MEPITDDEIVKIVSKCRSKQSCGYDGLNMTMVKRNILSIVKPLTNICNKLFQNGVFPVKIAKVKPLFKSGDKKQFSN